MSADAGYQIARDLMDTLLTCARAAGIDVDALECNSDLVAEDLLDWIKERASAPAAAPTAVGVDFGSEPGAVVYVKQSAAPTDSARAELVGDTSWLIFSVADDEYGRMFQVSADVRDRIISCVYALQDAQREIDALRQEKP